MVRAVTRPSGSFEVNAGLHQQFVLSPLVFAVVMDIDVISNEKISDLPSELLYED